MGRKTLRERFEENYTAVPVPAKNRRGFRMRYIYYAPWYLWALPEPQLRREKRYILFCSAAGLILFLLSAAQPSALNRSPLVFLPVAAALCCHVAELFALLQFMAAQYRTTKMTWEDVDRALRFAPPARALCCGFCALACLASLVKGFSPRTVCMAAGFGAAALTARAVNRRYSRIPLSVEDNHALQKADAAFEEDPPQL